MLQSYAARESIEESLDNPLTGRVMSLGLRAEQHIDVGEIRMRYEAVILPEGLIQKTAQSSCKSLPNSRDVASDH
jgi:hypothetical protein